MLETVQVEGHRRESGRPKKCLAETLQNDIFEFSLSSLLAIDKAIT